MLYLLAHAIELLNMPLRQFDLWESLTFARTDRVYVASTGPAYRLSAAQYDGMGYIDSNCDLRCISKRMQN